MVGIRIGEEAAKNNERNDFFVMYEVLHIHSWLHMEKQKFVTNTNEMDVIINLWTITFYDKQVHSVKEVKILWWDVQLIYGCFSRISGIKTN